MGSTKIITGAFGFAGDEEKKTGFLSVATRANLIVEVSADLEGLRRRYPEADLVDQSGKIFLPTFSTRTSSRVAHLQAGRAKTSDFSMEVRTAPSA